MQLEAFINSGWKQLKESKAENVVAENVAEDKKPGRKPKAATEEKE